MTGFEPRTFGVGSNHFAKWTTTTGRAIIIILCNDAKVKKIRPIFTSSLTLIKQGAYLR